MNSRERLILRKYWRAKSHYAYAVARRYLRSSRITILTFEGARQVRRSMMAHFDRREIYVHDEQYVLSYWICHKLTDEVQVLLEGKPFFVSRRRLAGLQSEYRKSQKLRQWDHPWVMRRLADLCLDRREREYRRLAALSHQFKCLLRAPLHKRTQKAAHLLEIFSERI